MKLSAEQFAELAASFDARQSNSDHERRRAARLDLEARVRITPIVSGQRLESELFTVCNFSARGLALIHPQPMELGQQFITELPRKSGGVLEFLCTVVHVDQPENSAYRIGAEFTCMVPAMSDTPHPAPQQNNAESNRIRESMLG